MANQKTITAQMLESLQRNPSCGFDQLVADCSKFTWNQLYHEVDRLSRWGQLCLTRVGGDNYFLRLPHSQESTAQLPAPRVSLLSPNATPRRASRRPL